MEVCPRSWALQYSSPSTALFLQAFPALVVPLHSSRPDSELQVNEGKDQLCSENI